MTDIDDYDELDGPEQIPLFHRVIHWPLFVIHIVFDFVRQYLFRRPWVLLPSALPAVAAGLIALAVGTWMVVQSDDTVITRIEGQLQDAIDAEDLAKRRVCLKALMQRNPNFSSYRFQYALLLREDGKDQAGQVLLEELASEGDEGYRPAHRLLSAEAMTRYGETTDAAEKQTLRRTAIRHLEAIGKGRGSQLDYRLGMLYAEDGDLSLAELQLKRAAKDGYGAAQMMLSRMQLLQGDPEAAGKLREQARKSLESYIAEHPTDLEARITWARCLLDGGEWAKLTQVLDGLERLDTDADYRDRLGLLSLAASQEQPLASPAAAKRAIQYAQWALPLLLDPGPAAWRLVALASQGLAVPSEAIDEVRDWLDQAADEQAEDASRWLLRARLEELAKELHTAEEAYKRAAELDSNSLPELASFYRRRENTEQLAEIGRQIIETFEPRLSEDPEPHLARAALAETYADQGRWEEARELLAAAADNPRLRFTLAVICIREFDTEMAASSQTPDAQSAEHPTEPADEGTHLPAERAPDYELLQTALRSVPGYGPAIARFEGELYRESSAGRDVLHRFLLEMLASGEQPAAIHRLLGLRASWLKDWSAAVGHFEQAVRLLPNDAFLHNNLAYSLVKAETSNAQLRRAELLANEALQLAPEHPEILATRGEILVRLKEYKAATEDLEKALTSLQQRSDLYQLLAECYDAAGLKSLADIHRDKAQQTERQGDGS